MAENDACHNTATQRRMLLLEIDGRGTTKLSVSPTYPGPSAEDRGFEPLRAVNPTRVPGERHRPLGESSAAMVADLPDAPVGSLAAPSPVAPLLPSGRQVLHSPWTPRGVYPVNSPRAGRQQGSMGS